MVRPRKDGTPSARCKKSEGRPLEWTEARIEEEADLLLEWIERPTSLLLNRFALERGYHPTMFARFRERSQKFCLALECAKTWQETKLNEGGIDKSFNQQQVMANLYQYHKWDRPAADNDEKLVDQFKALMAQLTQVQSGQ